MMTCMCWSTGRYMLRAVADGKTHTANVVMGMAFFSLFLALFVILKIYTNSIKTDVRSRVDRALFFLLPLDTLN